MKKILLGITLIYLSTLIAFAQNLTLTYGGVNYANGDTMTIVSTDTHTPMISYMGIKNNSANDIKVRVKKVIIDTLPGTENYFCWTSCYLSTVYIGDTMTIKAGATDANHFSGDYDPWGVTGKSRIMYVFYNDANHNDSVAFVAEFYAGSGVGFNSIEKINASINVYPNPAKSAITLDYELPTSQTSARFELRNVLGSVVILKNLQSESGKQKVDISNLQNGVYFYTLVINNEAVLSKKLIIKN